MTYTVSSGTLNPTQLNSCLYYCLPDSQINCLQHVAHCITLRLFIVKVTSGTTMATQLLSLASGHAVVKATKFFHVASVLRYLHWLKTNEFIEYKL